MAYPEFIRLSPNASSRPAHEQKGVLLHHSVLPFDATIDYMLDPGNQVSYHCLISPTGVRCTLVNDDQIAWHAGASIFKGRSRCNDFLLGLAFAGNTYETPLTEAQVGSALEWFERRWHVRRWTLQEVTDHRQVSPGRKDDLNPVEWQRIFHCLKLRFPGKD